MEAPYPTQGGNPNVIPEPDIEHQWVQGVQDDERRSRKRNIALIWSAGSVAICCATICSCLLFVVAPIVFVAVWFAFYTHNYD